MIYGHKARAQSALLLSVLLIGCENKANKTARELEACDAARHSYRTVVAAMCIPWGEQRGKVLAELVDAVRDDATTPPGSDPSQDVYGIATHVTSEDCERAGFPDPGAKFADPRSEHQRQEIRKIIKSFPELAKPESAATAKALARIHARCDFWAEDVPPGLRVKGSTP
jgi:hypothetical protein